MFVWKDDVDDATKQRVLNDVKVLGDEPDVERVTVGTSIEGLRTDLDWILDVQLADRDAAERFLAGERYRETIADVANSTKYEWTARMTHRMHGH
jgi:hypothetical protein